MCGSQTCSTFVALATSRGARGLQGRGGCGVTLEGAAVAAAEGQEGRGHRSPETGPVCYASLQRGYPFVCQAKAT